VAVDDKSSLLRGILCYKNSKKDLKVMAIIDRWSLAQVRLYFVKFSFEINPTYVCLTTTELSMCPAPFPKNVQK